MEIIAFKGGSLDGNVRLTLSREEMEAATVPDSTRLCKSSSITCPVGLSQRTPDHSQTVPELRVYRENQASERLNRLRG